MAETFEVPVRGIGKPDYTREVSSGKERAGLSLAYNQSLKIFGRSLNIGDALYPLVPVTSLAVGASTHLRDLETNLPMPYTVPQGYILTIISGSSTINEDVMVYSYMDNGLITTCLTVMSSGQLEYHNEVLGLSTEIIDPIGAFVHTLDFIIYNRGLGDLYGGIQYVTVLEALGTPPLPTIKDCMCPYCENIQTVPVDTSDIICIKCGKLYKVYNLTKFRRSS